MEMTPNELVTIIKALTPEAQFVAVPDIIIPLPSSLLAGDKIQLIKAYRSATNTGLLEAKTAVETGKVSIPAKNAGEFIAVCLQNWGTLRENYNSRQGW